MGLFQFEETFQIVKVLGFLLDLSELDVVLVNQGISVADQLEAVLVLVLKRQSGQEFLTEILHLLAESHKVLLDIGGFLGLQRKDIRLDLEDLLCRFVEEGLGVVNSLERLLIAFLLGKVTVLFKHVDHFLNAADDAVGLGFHFLHVRDSFHHIHEQVLIGVIITFGRVLDNALGCITDELTDILERRAELVLQERSKDIDPGQHLSIQRVLQRLEGDL